ncbi:MAG: hypothetical protein ACOC6S_03720 [Chloroflexota bacterium]
MTDQLLARYLELGFPHVRAVAKLPEELIPDFANVARTLGDEAMLGIAEPLELAKTVKGYLARAPDPDGLSSQAWQEAIAQWPAVGQVLPVAMALLHASEKVGALERKGTLTVDFTVVRSLAVIACCPFFPKGAELLSRLAELLGGTGGEPASLLQGYIIALETGDSDTLDAVDGCIMENPSWREWAERLVAAGQGFPFQPKVIGVSPDLTNALKQVLASMVMEVINADNGPNYRN